MDAINTFNTSKERENFVSYFQSYARERLSSKSNEPYFVERSIAVLSYIAVFPELVDATVIDKLLNLDINTFSHKEPYGYSTSGFTSFAVGYNEINVKTMGKTPGLPDMQINAFIHECVHKTSYLDGMGDDHKFTPQELFFEEGVTDLKTDIIIESPYFRDLCREFGYNYMYFKSSYAPQKVACLALNIATNGELFFAHTNRNIAGTFNDYKKLIPTINLFSAIEGYVRNLDKGKVPIETTALLLKDSIDIIKDKDLSVSEYAQCRGLYRYIERIREQYKQDDRIEVLNLQFQNKAQEVQLDRQKINQYNDHLLDTAIKIDLDKMLKKYSNYDKDSQKIVNSVGSQEFFSKYERNKIVMATLDNGATKDDPVCNAVYNELQFENAKLWEVEQYLNAVQQINGKQEIKDAYVQANQLAYDRGDRDALVNINEAISKER